MKTTIIKSKILTAALLGIFLLSGTSLFAQKANYSGNWSFNESKSQLGEGRFRAPASKLVIAQSDTVLNIEKTSKDMNGEDQVVKEKYLLNGKTSENAGFMNNVKKSTAAWSADNKTLTLNSISVFERDGNTMETKTVEAFVVSEDGKSLTINTSSVSSRGERKQTLAYDKADK